MAQKGRETRKGLEEQVWEEIMPGDLKKAL